MSIVPVLYDPGFVITVPADGLAPLGARPSADTLLTETLQVFFKVSSLVNRVIIGSGNVNDLSPAWCQAIIWINDELLWIGQMQTFSHKRINLQMLSAKNICHFVSGSMC